MRPSDLITGLVVLAGGLAAAGYAQTFPPMPGQRIGPGLFPTVIGLGLALAGGVLALSGLTQRGAPWVEIEDWARNPRAFARAALVIGLLIAYTLVVNALGFFITGSLFLAVLCAAFGARGAWIVPLAIGVPFAIHYCFYTVLGVPLPWGVFEGIAW